MTQVVPPPRILCSQDSPTRGTVVRMKGRAGDLDGVRWHELAHAYGAADDTPRLLRQVEVGEADAETWHALFTSLAHQGTVYSASAAAVPFLLDLSTKVSGTDRAYVMGLLESIAGGDSEDAATERACVQAAQQGLARYVDILTEDEDDGDDGYEEHGDSDGEEDGFEDEDDGDDGYEEGAPDLHAVTASLLTHVLLRAELSSDALADRRLRSKLTRLFDVGEGRAATVAAIALVKSCDPASADDASRYFELIVRDFAKPLSEERLTSVRTLLRSLSPALRPALFDALLSGARHADRSDAFDLGHAVLWLAFHRRLGGSAVRPRPFVMVESEAFPMPCDFGFGPPAIVERVPGQVHWRDVTKRPPGVDRITLPYVTRWDQPERPRLDTPALSKVSVAEPIAAGQLTNDERRAIEMLVAWDAFWRTESDLLMVYGLPVERSQLTDVMA